MDKGATEKINILECLSLHTAIYLTLSARFLTTWSLEHRTTMGKNGGLSHMYLEYSLAVPNVMWVGRLLNSQNYFFLYKMVIMNISKGTSQKSK